jgi:hypothetical protein
VGSESCPEIPTNIALGIVYRQSRGTPELRKNLLDIGVRCHIPGPQVRGTGGTLSSMKTNIGAARHRLSSLPGLKIETWGTHHA